MGLGRQFLNIEVGERTEDDRSVLFPLILPSFVITVGIKKTVALFDLSPTGVVTIMGLINYVVLT